MGNDPLATPLPFFSQRPEALRPYLAIGLPSRGKLCFYFLEDKQLNQQMRKTPGAISKLRLAPHFFCCTAS
jgi:hypothetical protein